MITERVPQRFAGLVVVAAPGPSLTPAVAERCKGIPTVACKGAYELFPDAEVLYQCAATWWDRHKGCPNFKGDKWTSHGQEGGTDDKRELAAKYGLHLVRGKPGWLFSLDPRHIHYGKNSGFQAINLAILMGGNPIVLVGFDMRSADGNRYFNGKHPTHRQQDYGFREFIEAFGFAARHLPRHLTIINATPGSALKCFPRKTLDDALSHRP
jgi:hypothetical protein